MGWQSTHYNDSAGDGDGCQQTVGDGVGLQRVSDALVVAVDAPLVRPEHEVHDDEWQRRWRERQETAGVSGSHLKLNSPTHSTSQPTPSCDLHTQTANSPP